MQHLGTHITASQAAGSTGAYARAYYRWTWRFS
jgi:hypothetical protein